VKTFRPSTIRVFLLERVGGEEDRVFQVDLVSTWLTCTFIAKKHVKEVCDKIASEHDIHNGKRLGVLRKILPEFLVNPEVAKGQFPEFTEFFNALSEEMKKFA